MKKTFLSALLLCSLAIRSQNMNDFVKVSAFEIKVLKLSPEAITYINNIKNKEKLPVVIGPDCTQKDFEEICKQLNWITSLKIGSSYPNKTSVSDLKAILVLKSLKELGIFSTINAAANKLLDISPVSKHVSLEKLTLAANSLINTSKLSTLTNLSYLSISDAKLKDISFMANMIKLQTLSISGDGNTFVSVDFLSNLKALEKLEIKDHNTLSEENLKSISALTNLKVVELDNCKNIKNLDFLANSIKLEEFSGSDCELLNINGLINASNLSELHFENTKITSIDPLKEKRKLRKLEITNTKVTDLSPLSNCVSLETLKISSTISEQQQSDLKSKLPDLDINVKE